MGSTYDIPWYPRFHSFKCACPQATTSQAYKCKVDGIQKLSNLKQTLLEYIFYSCQISIHFKVIVLTSRSNYQHSKFKSNGFTNDYNP
jgi:hypothetical protein